MAINDWLAQDLSSERLELELLRVEHAAEMAPLLDDVAAGAAGRRRLLVDVQ